MKRHRHPALRAAVALAVLALVFHAVGAVLAAVLLFALHHAALIVGVAAARMFAGMVPGLHRLLAAFIGYRLTHLLIGDPR